jgi:hypothetical protein
MHPAAATFEIRDVISVPGRTDTFVTGVIKGGVVKAGMFAKGASPNGAVLIARVKGVEHVGHSTEKDIVALALDTPEKGGLELWRNHSRSGDLLTIDNAANHVPDPTSPSVTPPAGAGGAPSVATDH